MKSIQEICDELKGLEGTVGAFVCNDGVCLASSLPKNYDTDRLEQTAGELTRLSQLAQKASYNQCSCVFHWQRASLFCWGLKETGVLAVLALPSAPRGVVELSASIAIEDLLPLLGQRASLPQAQANSDVMAAASEVAAPVSAAEEHPRLRDLEELVISELGPTGRVLFLRARQKTYRIGLPESNWLPKLRAAVLADLGDPTAWAGIAASVMWIPSAD